jgi:hypothetical protein
MSLIGRLQPSRRAILAAGPGLLLSSSVWAGVDAPLETSPVRCADFLQTIGVNTHLGYADSQYDDLSATLAALDYIGVRHVRDAAINPDRPNAGHYRAAAKAGVRFCMFWGPKRTMDEAIRPIAALEAEFPGAVQALEGPNEIKPNFSYAGLAGNDAGRRFMADMRVAASAHEPLRRKPLVSLTSYARVAVDCDYANAHPYPKAGMQPGSILARDHDRQAGPGGAMPGKPMMYTEFGYHTLVGKPLRPNEWQGVDPERQAVLLLNGLFDNAAARVARTYVYQLLDAYADKGGPNMEHHFGLFERGGRPKAAAAALHTLSGLLTDDGPRAHEFSPTPLAAKAALPAPVSGLVLENGSGRYFLALWNESPVWAPETATPREVAPMAVTVSLAGPKAVRVHDLIDPRLDADLGVVSSVRATVGAHPLLLRIG